MKFKACCEILHLTKDDLGIDPESIDQCTIDQLEKDIIFFIKYNFKNLARKYHPDKGGDEETFKSLLLAYETALTIVENEIKRKKNPETFSSKNIIAFEPDLNAMNFNDLLKHISRRDPNLLQKFWDENEKEKEAFSSKVAILNSRLQNEYNQQQEKTFEKAFADYLKNSDQHYASYLNLQYNKYRNKFQSDQLSKRNLAIAKYEAEIKSADALIIAGFFICFLILPLIASLLGWRLKVRATNERHCKLTAINKKTPQSQNEWIQSYTNNEFRKKWEQNVQYKTPLELIKSCANTEEKLNAIEILRPFEDALFSKTMANNKMSEQVGVYRSVESGESFLYYSLYTECKANMTSNKKEPEELAEERHLSISM